MAAVLPRNSNCIFSNKITRCHELLSSFLQTETGSSQINGQFPQLSIMSFITHGHKYMVNFNSMDQVYIVRRQSDLVNTKEWVPPVCGKPYHMNNRILQKWQEIEFGELCIMRPVRLRNGVHSTSLSCFYVKKYRQSNEKVC